ncbi:MAG: bifunctional pyr operon transcriptional regulator/uracil phosphoribosyltransferase [Deltaproteobacteria bacterium RBG_13_58_19]|nr:MAG: bifunctional pyr operon transcriptional regulator/uracil phosphoribosyltransferase [Deltaproteobacteria bacterium RBG_13_58_19]
MTSEKNIALNADELDQALDRLTGEILGRHQNPDELVIVGIRTGGAFLAQRLADKISRRVSAPMRVGVLDITLYRDDWTRISHKPLVGKTELPGSIDDQEILLVDDVLFTGRTVRAALDALIDYGRPRRIELVVLVDRGGRELPIQPDYVGLTLDLPPAQRVNVYLKEMGRTDEVALEAGHPQRP